MSALDVPAGTPAEIHPSSVVDRSAFIGAGVRIWHFCHVMAGAVIGRDSMLGHACFVGKDVRIGAGVRIQNHVSVFEGVELEDEVFVGPSAVFTNVLHPRAGLKREFLRTLVRRGATLGANVTVLPGVEIGEFAFVGAGAVVAAGVPSHALMVGVPARQIGWVGRCGEALTFEGTVGTCPVSGERYELDGGRLSRLGR